MDIGAVLWAIASKWLELAPVLLGLLLTVSELRHVRNAQKISNQLEVTKQHREIWSTFLVSPSLGRVLESNIDLKKHPITNEESLFVTFLILHLKTTFRARRFGMILPAEALREDIRWFFSLPIPKAVWEKSMDFQDTDFRSFLADIRER